MKKIVPIVVALLAFCSAGHFSTVFAVNTYGFLGNITDAGEVTGWAEDTDAPTTHISVDVYMDGPYGTGTFVGHANANLAQFNQTYGFSLLVPQLKDGKPHSVYAYGIDETGGGKNNLLLGSPQTFPMAPTSVYYNEPNYPTSSGWAADTTNYFTKWQCSSTAGINTIYRLDIASLGKHSQWFWKDSLFVNNVDYADGSNIVYFTAGLASSSPKFALKKATYSKSLNKWTVSDVLNHPSIFTGGFSSQDGIGDDYVMNEYAARGWGPTSHLPGSQSKIPGVSDTPTAPGVPSYPLVGTGPLGLTTITSVVQNNGYVGYSSCIHMNPTLFDFDANGVPHSMAAYLFTTQDTATPCKLPPGAPIATLPYAGHYVYHYINATQGWQLDLTTGNIDKEQSSVLNYIYGSNKKFLSARYNGIVQTIDITLPDATRTKTLLDCSKSGIHMAEGTGQLGQFFFIATPFGAALDQAYNLDIYFAFNANATAPAKPGDLNGDGKVDVFDYNVLVANFGHPYTIFDYNTLVANYRK